MHCANERSSFHALLFGFTNLHDIFDSSDEANVVFDQFGQLEELC